MLLNHPLGELMFVLFIITCRRKKEKGAGEAKG